MAQKDLLKVNKALLRALHKSEESLEKQKGLKGRIKQRKVVEFLRVAKHFTMAALVMEKGEECSEPSES